MILNSFGNQIMSFARKNSTGKIKLSNSTVYRILSFSMSRDPNDGALILFVGNAASKRRSKFMYFIPGR